MCPDFVITSFIEMPDSIIGRTETDSRADTTQNSGFTCKVLTINGQVSICRTGYHFLPHKLQHIMRSQLPNESNYFNMQQFMICFGLLGKIKDNYNCRLLLHTHSYLFPLPNYPIFPDSCLFLLINDRPLGETGIPPISECFNITWQE